MLIEHLYILLLVFISTSIQQLVFHYVTFYCIVTNEQRPPHFANVEKWYIHRCLPYLKSTVEERNVEKITYWYRHPMFISFQILQNMWYSSISCRTTHFCIKFSQSSWKPSAIYTWHIGFPSITIKILLNKVISFNTLST